MKYENLSKLILLILFSSISTGCVYTASFDKSPYLNQAALQEHLSSKEKKNPENIIVLKNFPQKNYVILGTLQAPQVEWTAHYTTEDLVEAMQKKAAQMGADAIVNFRTKADPSMVVTHYTGSGMITSTPYKGLYAWAEAIIFVTPEEKSAIDPQ